MQFVVVPNDMQTPDSGYDVAYLWADNWNDWYKYRTLYFLTYFDSTGEKHSIGSVKIGQFGMAEEQYRPDLPATFERLDQRFFSVGQDIDYYSAVTKLGPDLTGVLLDSLNDIAHNDSLFQRALNEDVTGQSLLRFVNIKTILGQFRRTLSGGATLTEYMFRYYGPSSQLVGTEPLRLEFIVTPDSRPPTNIHVLIGRNGVGKTHILNAMTRALIIADNPVNIDGSFVSVIGGGFETREIPFANILSITFSAFDDFEIIRQSRNATEGTRYTNVGLRKRVKDKKDEWVTITRDPEDLAKEFSASAKLCVRGNNTQRWRKALNTLEADPLFAEAEVATLANLDDESFGRAANALYKRLSSGHKIVLLTIAKIVENVEEKTLVLIDEPEAHLHPPLLSAFLRALSDLLIDRNGVAIIATHSPVVLQEVPRSCVWKIVRHGHAINATRPTIETFAENVGVLTREIFGLEVTRSGFHKMLADAVNNEQLIDDIVIKFDNKVGSEGRALISSMISTNNSIGEV